MKLARGILAGGATLSVAAAFGPVWVVRAGVLLAIVGGVLALTHAFRAISEQRRTAGDQLIHQTRAHGTALRAERVHHAEVLGVLAARISSTQASLTTANAEVVQQHVKIVALRDELQTVHGRTTDLRHQLDEVQTQLSLAQETSAQQEAELFVLRAEAEIQDDERNAEIVGIPRRSRIDDVDQAPTASVG